MDARLEEIKARAQAATSGPWYWHQPAGFAASCFVRSETDPTYRDYAYIAGDVSGNANCDFIAHSRSDVDYLTARLTVLAGAVREYVTGRSHMPYCGAAYDRGDPCHCGLDKLTAALGAER